MQVRQCDPILESYAAFTKAQNIGIVFGPNDLSIESMEYFGIIRSKTDELSEGHYGQS